MRTILIPLLIISLFTNCRNSTEKEPTSIPADQVTPDHSGSPFQGTAIRYDGHYSEEDRGVVYLIRFFPDGRAVLINGSVDVAHELPSYLTADAKGDPVLGWYNVPVTVENDSIFFKTYPEKGEINYRGNVPSTSMVRLLRHSHINGSQAIKEYIFKPDQASGK